MRTELKWGISVLAVAVSTLFMCSNSEVDLEKPSATEPINNYAVYAIAMPQNLTLAGEKLPTNDPDVYERLDRELHVNTYWQSNTLLTIKLANKYFAIIEPILKKNGVPDDFKYLAVIESGLRNVVSPAGAAGFWQFMKTTGKEYDLEITSEVDERYHLEKATEAACIYLLSAKEKFGSWTLAAASYNMGMAGLQKQLDRQKATNYYDLLLNLETSRYVLRIVALKEILENPIKYGFHFSEDDLYTLEKTKVLTVDSAIANLADFAKMNNMSYKTLKVHNPWLRQNYLKNTSKKTYKIKVTD